MNPKKANLPYVYDNFEWKHCAALGYDIASRSTSATTSDALTSSATPPANANTAFEFPSGM